VEELALDRGALESVALPRAELVEPGTQQRVQARRQVARSPHASYENYLAKAQIAYSQTPFTSAPITCVALIGVPPERALNDYVKGNTSWAACLSRVALSAQSNCQSGPGYGARRVYWSDASKNVSKAVNNLD
jgi:hypothetical protein